MSRKVIFALFAALFLQYFAIAQVPFKPRNADEEHAWRLYNQYLQSKQKEAQIRKGLEQIGADIRTTNVGSVPGLFIDPRDIAKQTKLKEDLEAEQARQKNLEAAWDRKFFGNYGNLSESSVPIYDPKTKTTMDTIRFRLMYFPFGAGVNNGGGQGRIVPRPGLYRLNGGSAGQTFEISAVSPTSFRFRHWQTGTPEPPPPGSYFYAIGQAQLLPDGKTWLILQKNIDGWCCGNMIDSEIQFTNETTFIGVRYRLWDPAGPKPEPSDGWRSSGSGEYKLVGAISEPGKSPAQPPFIPSPGRDSGARIVSLSGEVEWFPIDNSRDRHFGKTGASLPVEAVIATGDDSNVVIGFSDSSVITIKSDSMVVIGEPAGKLGKMALLSGKISANIKKILSGESIEIKSNLAVCGIKGTAFDLSSNPDFDEVSVGEGIVSVTHELTRETQDLYAGTSVRLTRKGFVGGTSATTASSNLAVGKTATQSSTGYDCPADRAVDGNREGDYFKSSLTHTNDQYTSGHWWQVDLGAVHRIDELVIWNRTDCCPERLSDFDVFVSEQPFRSDDANLLRRDGSIKAIPYSGAAGRETRVAVGYSGRYVRIQLRGKGPLSLAEVEVLGILRAKSKPSASDPAGSADLQKRSYSPETLGNIWRTREENPSGQGCDGTWARRSGTNIFDARWQCVGGPVSDVVEIEKVNGNQVVVYRRGVNNRYTLTLSPDGRKIISGRIAWAPDWKFSGQIEY